MSNIEWTNITANPIHLIREDGSHGGHWCHKVSSGCAKCYSETQNQSNYFKFASKLSYTGSAPDNLIFDEKVMQELIKMRSPKKVFLGSMTDIFGEWVLDAWLDRAFAYMAITSQHTFQILTKRPERMREYITDTHTPFRVARQIDCLNVLLISRSIQQEIKPIEDYPGYYVSNHGQVFSENGSSVCLYCGSKVEGIASKKYCSIQCKQNAHYHKKHTDKQTFAPQLKIMLVDQGEQGHLRVALYKNGVKCKELVHRLVLTAFSRYPFGNEQACHIDGNSGNNHIANLRWGSQSDNWVDRKRHGNHRSYNKLRISDINEIRKSKELGVSTSRLAKQFLVSETQIVNICEGKQWKQELPIEWPLKNCWLGTSVENQATADDRIPSLLQTPATVRFLSCEPLLESIDLRKYLHGISWVIVGLESGTDARRCDLQAVHSIIQQCKSSKTPVFCKQLGTVWAKESGTYRQDSKGGNPELWDESLNVREFPI